MKYPSGNDIAICDPIWWNEGTCVGRASLILETAEQLKEWSLDEPGIFVCCDFSGKTTTQDVFYPRELFEDDGIERMTSAEATEVKDLYVKLCSLNPAAKDCRFNVRRHINSMKWLFVVFLEASEKHYAIFDGSTEFVTVEKKDI